MSILTIMAEERNETGGNSATDLRNEGFVPAVVYGNHQDTKNIKVSKSDIIKVINKNGTSAQVKLKVQGKTVSTIIKEVQNDVLKYDILHVDFQRLSENETIKIKLPIQLEGTSKVENNSTLVQHQLNEIEIECLPQYLVENIVADVSGISIGHPFKVSDLEIFKDENISVLSDPNEVIATLVVNNTNEEETETETEIEPELV